MSTSTAAAKIWEVERQSWQGPKKHGILLLLKAMAEVGLSDSGVVLMSGLEALWAISLSVLRSFLLLSRFLLTRKPNRRRFRAYGLYATQPASQPIVCFVLWNTKSEYSSCLSTRSLFLKIPKIPVQDASNVSKTIKCASTCRKGNRNSSPNYPRSQNQRRKALPISLVLITSSSNYCGDIWRRFKQQLQLANSRIGAQQKIYMKPS